MSVTAHPGFDAAQFKATTRAQWQAAAEAWHRWGPLVGRWLGEATEAMFDMAGLGPGSRVLDVAAGAGEQSLAAARRVLPDGHVLATDLAPALLEHAASDAEAAGLASVKVRELDGEALDDLSPGTFDAAISRVGLIYFPDQLRAVDGMRRAVAPGGRVAAVVYSTPERNGFFSIPVRIIRERAELPARARTTRPVLPRSGRRPRVVVHSGGPAGCRSPQDTLTGPAAQRSRVRQVRA